MIACVLLVSTQASRTQVHEGLEIQSQTKWGASCDTLQDQFHDRVSSIQASLEGLTETTELTGVARTRLTMKMYGTLRTLRRAKDCSWVIENDSVDLDQLRGVVQRLLAGNQCAESARLELERGSSEDNAESIPRAMSILMSDDCEVPEVPEGSNTDATPEEQLQLAEDELQDRIEEINDVGSAFIESDKTQVTVGLLRGFGVFLMMLFLLLACTAAAALIVFVLVMATTFLLVEFFPHTNFIMSRWNHGNYGMIQQITALTYGGTFLVGLPRCAYQLFNNLRMGEYNDVLGQ